MFDFNFLQIIEDYVHTYQNFAFPVTLCDTEFRVYWSNMLAKRDFVPITKTETLDAILGEYNLQELSASIYETGGKTLAGVIPFNTLRFNLSPLISQGDYVGIILIVTQPEDSPSWEKLQAVSTASSVFSNDMRDTVAGIFYSMDSMALKSELFDADWIKPHLSRIALDSYRILRMSNNITLFARFRNLEADLDLSSYNIFGWLRKIEESVALVGDDMGVPIEFNIAQGDEYLSLDTKKFETAFFNVLHNSLYYTKVGNVVTISAEALKDNVLITIQDKGLGIPADALPQVFRPYFSYMPPGFPPNLGLGLTISHMVFAAHGGEIIVDSVEGQGTTVRIYLPYPNFTDSLTLAQGDETYSLQDRFSPMYIGLTCAKNSPFTSIVLA